MRVRGQRAFTFPNARRESFRICAENRRSEHAFAHEAEQVAVRVAAEGE
jgi:hypothetical protein